MIVATRQHHRSDNKSPDGKCHNGTKAAFRVTVSRKDTYGTPCHSAPSLPSGPLLDDFHAPLNF